MFHPYGTAPRAGAFRGAGESRSFAQELDRATGDPGDDEPCGGLSGPADRGDEGAAGASARPARDGAPEDLDREGDRFGSGRDKEQERREAAGGGSLDDGSYEGFAQEIGAGSGDSAKSGAAAAGPRDHGSTVTPGEFAPGASPVGGARLGPGSPGGASAASSHGEAAGPAGAAGRPAVHDPSTPPGTPSGPAHAAWGGARTPGGSRAVPQRGHAQPGGMAAQQLAGANGGANGFEVEPTGTGTAAHAPGPGGAPSTLLFAGKQGASTRTLDIRFAASADASSSGAGEASIPYEALEEDGSTGETGRSHPDQPVEGDRPHPLSGRAAIELLEREFGPDRRAPWAGQLPILSGPGPGRSSALFALRPAGRWSGMGFGEPPAYSASGAFGSRLAAAGAMGPAGAAGGAKIGIDPLSPGALGSSTALGAVRDHSHQVLAPARAATPGFLIAGDGRGLGNAGGEAGARGGGVASATGRELAAAPRELAPHGERQAIRHAAAETPAREEPVPPGGQTGTSGFAAFRGPGAPQAADAAHGAAGSGPANESAEHTGADDPLHSRGTGQARRAVNMHLAGKRDPFGDAAGSAGSLSGPAGGEPSSGGGERPAASREQDALAQAPREAPAAGPSGHTRQGPQAASAARFESLLRDAAQRIEHMVRNVEAGSRDAGEYLRLQLAPSGRLGELDLELSVERGVLSARFVAQSEQVRALIESALPDLRERLAERGVQVDHLDVSVGEHGRRDAAEPWDRPEGPGRALRSEPDAPTVSEERLLFWDHRPAPGGMSAGVDVLV